VQETEGEKGKEGTGRKRVRGKGKKRETVIPILFSHFKP